MSKLPDFVQQSNVDLKDRVSGFFGNETKHDSLITSVEDLHKDVKGWHGEVVEMRDEVNATAEEIRVSSEEIKVLGEEIRVDAKDARDAAALAVAAKDRTLEAEAVVTAEVPKAILAASQAIDARDAAEGYAHDARGFANNALISEQEAKKSADLSVEIYEDLRKGQVYRGTWNPHTGAYPDNEGTNSVWDVILNPNETEYDWDGIKWFWGDRLVYVKETNKYQQVESGSSGNVTSVNGKKGAVVLSATDVNALPLTGGTMTGVIQTSLSGNLLRYTNPNGNGVTEQAFVNDYLDYRMGSNSITKGIQLSDYNDPRVQLNRSGTVWTKAGFSVGPEKHTVYHQGYETTPQRIGALPITGGTINGSVTINSNNGLVVRDGDYSARIVNTGGLVYFQGGKTDRNDPQAIAISGYFGSPLTDLRFIMAPNTSPVVRWGGASHKVYSEGFKPTPQEIGAMSSIGDGVTTGNLRSNNPINPLVELHSPGKHASMLWVDHNNGDTNISRSNGAGVESLRLASWSPSGSMWQRGSLRIPSEGSFWGNPTANGGIVPLVDDVRMSVGEWHPLVTSPVYQITGQGYQTRWQIGHYRNVANQNGQFVINMTGDGLLTNNLRYNFNSSGQFGVEGTHDGSTYSLHSGGYLSGTIFGSAGNMVEWCRASFAPISDKKLKKNIKPATKSALEDVAKIDFVSYDWKDSGRKATAIGVTAQQMEEIDPSYSKNIETFKPDGSVDTSVKALDVTNCLALALKAIQELQARVAELEAK